MKQQAKWMILLVVVILLATTTAVFAGGPGDHGRPSGPGGVSGKVTAVGTNTLTVLTADGKSVTVKTSSSTKVEILATGASGSLSDIVVGSQVEVHGPQNQDGSVTAEVIILLPAGDELHGRVTAINDKTITIQAPGGTSSTIVTTTSTTFRKGQDAASLSDVAVGQELRAFGALQTDGSLTATLVLIHEGPGGSDHGPGGPGGPGGVSGKVTAVGTDTLTVLTADSKSVAVTTSSSTKVEILDTGASGSLSDIVVGSQVEVHGPQNQDGSVTAEVIILLPAGDELHGRVTAINDKTITIQAPGGTSSTIVTTTNTTFRKGQDAASLSDVAVGQELRAFGALQTDGSLTATLVLIHEGPGGSDHGPGGPGGGPGGPNGGPGVSNGGPGGSGGGGRH